MRISVKERMDVLEEIIAEAERDRYGAATARTFTIHRDVMMYLIMKGRMTMEDDEKVFQSYLDTYTIPALYRVAEYYRKQMGLPALNHKQSAYHDPQSVHRNPQEQM